MKTYLIKNGKNRYFLTCKESDLHFKLMDTLNHNEPHEVIRIDN